VSAVPLVLVVGASQESVALVLPLPLLATLCAVAVDFPVASLHPDSSDTTIASAHVHVCSFHVFKAQTSPKDRRAPALRQIKEPAVATSDNANPQLQ
jgi:hypothetical protein